MPRTITVKGIGRVSAKPDTIVISMTLAVQKTEYEDAMNESAKLLKSLRSAIEPLGFSQEDMKTTSLNVDTCYENEKDRSGNYKRKFTGYKCVHGLKLEFDLDTGRMAKVLSAIAHCDADPEFNVQFTVKDKDGICADLLKNASENALKKAQILCESSGVALGSLISIDYNWGEINLFSPTRFEMEDRCMMAAPNAAEIDVEPEDIDLTDTVAFVWEINKAQ